MLPDAVDALQVYISTSASWTFDTRRLPPSTVTLLESVMAWPPRSHVYVTGMLVVTAHPRVAVWPGETVTLWGLVLKVRASETTQQRGRIEGGKLTYGTVPITLRYALVDIIPWSELTVHVYQPSSLCCTSVMRRPSESRRDLKTSSEMEDVTQLLVLWCGLPVCQRSCLFCVDIYGSDVAGCLARYERVLSDLHRRILWYQLKIPSPDGL